MWCRRKRLWGWGPLIFLFTYDFLFFSLLVLRFFSPIGRTYIRLNSFKGIYNYWKFIQKVTIAAFASFMSYSMCFMVIGFFFHPLLWKSLFNCGWIFKTILPLQKESWEHMGSEHMSMMQRRTRILGSGILISAKWSTFMVCSKY